MQDEAMMKKLMLLGLFLGLSACQKDKDENVIRVGLSADYPPFEYMEKGKLVGFDVDLAEYMGKELNMKIEFKEMSFNSLIPALQKDHIDIVMAGMTATEERLKEIDFSDIYFNDQLAYIFRKDNQVDSLENYSMGVQLSSTMEVWAKKKFGDAANIVPLDSNNMLVEALKTGKIDTVIISEPQAKAFTKANSNLDYKIIGFIDNGCGIAMRKQSPLKEKINVALKNLKEKKVMDELIKKWIDTNVQ
jgi:polar amino acid transport system substrate-binding protein